MELGFYNYFFSSSSFQVIGKRVLGRSRFECACSKPTNLKTNDFPVRFKHTVLS